MIKYIFCVLAVGGLASCGVREPFAETRHFQCASAASLISDESEKQDTDVSNLTVSELSKPFDQGELGTQIFYSDQVINSVPAHNRDVRTTIVAQVRQDDTFNYQFVSSDGRSFTLSKDSESGKVVLSSPDFAEQQMQCREVVFRNQNWG